MITIIMAIAKVEDKHLYGSTTGKLPWGRVQEDMDIFVALTQGGTTTRFICSESTYNTLPPSVIKRLDPSITEFLTKELVDSYKGLDIVILGGRKLIDSAIPFAQHLFISEIAGIEKAEDTFIYLRKETMDKLSTFEFDSSCSYIVKPNKQESNKPYLYQCYCLSKF